MFAIFGNDRPSSGWGATAVVTGFLIAITGGTDIARAAPDVTPPDPPAGIFLDQGSSWRAANYFRIWWHNPSEQETPITVAHYEMCPAAPPGPCTTHQASGVDITELNISVPYAGGFWLRVWLEDEAGNVDPAAKSAQVMLRFDDQIPPVAHMDTGQEWLGADAPASPEYVIQLDIAASWPISGVGGYSVTTNGDMPDAEVEAHAVQDYERFQASYAFADLEEGVTLVRFRTVSNAGVPADAIGSAYLRLDRTAPVVDPTGVPPADRWHDKLLSVGLAARDQDGLSGMVASAPGSPVEAGAHIAYELDDGPVVRLRGPSGQVPVTQDGHHTLSYRAFDAAGNGSVEKEVAFKIDRTAPVGAFRALDAGDPRQLRVDVSDATSGVADGWIEYRREGESGFRRLDTTRTGGVLSGRLDDQALPPGRYALRAVVTDVAGNEAIVESWANGSAATLGMPLRLDASLTVAGLARAKAKKRCGKARKSRKRAKRRPKCRQAKPRPKASLTLPHGRRARSTGRLVTGQGAPIAGATVVVEGQARSGGPFVALGSARTDSRGELRYTIPAGPSRTIRYRYDGTNTVRPAAAQLTTKVTAAARLKVDRRRLRNGQSVRFSGRLLGKPIPAAGKLVALQAKVGRGWRTFATPRANAKGVFRHRYRFTATTGLRRYAFRAVIAREDAYPYERGVSRIVRVTVKGGR
jgi:hypothetical protein